ncbi:trichohyalin-like [Parambassis ranga]|uniref:Trichohyalin-like n=1 Tax=Parambassis ranga TaxID=210632 RepID=A0A6P7K028_9TELE|nr:trichohyalin-like [Parambassis ranga]
MEHNNSTFRGTLTRLFPFLSLRKAAKKEKKEQKRCSRYEKLASELCSLQSQLDTVLEANSLLTNLVNEKNSLEDRLTQEREAKDQCLLQQQEQSKELQLLRTTNSQIYTELTEQSSLVQQLSAENEALRQFTGPIRLDLINSLTAENTALHEQLKESKARLRQHEELLPDESYAKLLIKYVRLKKRLREQGVVCNIEQEEEELMEKRRLVQQLSDENKALRKQLRQLPGQIRLDLEKELSGKEAKLDKANAAAKEKSLLEEELKRRRQKEMREQEEAAEAGKRRREEREKLEKDREDMQSKLSEKEADVICLQQAVLQKDSLIHHLEEDKSSLEEELKLERKAHEDDEQIKWIGELSSKISDQQNLINSLMAENTQAAKKEKKEQKRCSRYEKLASELCSLQSQLDTVLEANSLLTSLVNEKNSLEDRLTQEREAKDQCLLQQQEQSKELQLLRTTNSQIHTELTEQSSLVQQLSAENEALRQFTGPIRLDLINSLTAENTALHEQLKESKARLRQHEELLPDESYAKLLIKYVRLKKRLREQGVVCNIEQEEEELMEKRRLVQQLSDENKALRKQLRQLPGQIRLDLEKELSGKEAKLDKANAAAKEKSLLEEELKRRRQKEMREQEEAAEAGKRRREEREKLEKDREDMQSKLSEKEADVISLQQAVLQKDSLIHHLEEDKSSLEEELKLERKAHEDDEQIKRIGELSSKISDQQNLINSLMAENTQAAKKEKKEQKRCSRYEKLASELCSLQSQLDTVLEANSLLTSLVNEKNSLEDRLTQEREAKDQCLLQQQEQSKELQLLRTTNSQIHTELTEQSSLVQQLSAENEALRQFTGPIRLDLINSLTAENTALHEQLKESKARLRQHEELLPDESYAKLLIKYVRLKKRLREQGVVCNIEQEEEELMEKRRLVQQLSDENKALRKQLRQLPGQIRLDLEKELSGKEAKLDKANAAAKEKSLLEEELKRRRQKEMREQEEAAEAGKRRREEREKLEKDREDMQSKLSEKEADVISLQQAVLQKDSLIHHLEEDKSSLEEELKLERKAHEDDEQIKRIGELSSKISDQQNLINSLMAENTQAAKKEKKEQKRCSRYEKLASELCSLQSQLDTVLEANSLLTNLVNEKNSLEDRLTQEREAKDQCLLQQQEQSKELQLLRTTNSQIYTELTEQSSLVQQLSAENEALRQFTGPIRLDRINSLTAENTALHEQLKESKARLRQHEELLPDESYAKLLIKYVRLKKRLREQGVVCNIEQEEEELMEKRRLVQQLSDENKALRKQLRQLPGQIRLDLEKELSGKEAKLDKANAAAKEKSLLEEELKRRRQKEMREQEEAAEAGKRRREEREKLEKDREDMQSKLSEKEADVICLQQAVLQKDSLIHHLEEDKSSLEEELKLERKAHEDDEQIKRIGELSSKISDQQNLINSLMAENTQYMRLKKQLRKQEAANTIEKQNPSH